MVNMVSEPDVENRQGVVKVKGTYFSSANINTDGTMKVLSRVVATLYSEPRHNRFAALVGCVYDQPGSLCSRRGAQCFRTPLLEISYIYSNSFLP